jgi:hypothetical protein
MHLRNVEGGCVNVGDRTALGFAAGPIWAWSPSTTIFHYLLSAPVNANVVVEAVSTLFTGRQPELAWIGQK